MSGYMLDGPTAMDEWSVTVGPPTPDDSGNAMLEVTLRNTVLGELGPKLVRVGWPGGMDARDIEFLATTMMAQSAKALSLMLGELAIERFEASAP